MRDIKFRQWYQNHMYYFGFIEGRNGCISFTCAQNNRLDKYPVMQFTGLVDKNGVDIYEGDIIKHPLVKKLLKVVWRNGCFCITSNGGGISDIYDDAPTARYSWEVLGNTHENPELLTKEI